MGKHGAPAPYPFLHSVFRIAEIALASREAANQLARNHMLARFMRAARTISVCRAQHLLRRAYPIDRNAEPVIFARAAVSQFARRHMLAPAEGIPE